MVCGIACESYCKTACFTCINTERSESCTEIGVCQTASGDCAVQEIVCSLKGSTDLTDIEHIRLYASAADGTLSVEHPLTLPMQVSEKFLSRNLWS